MSATLWPLMLGLVLALTCWWRTGLTHSTPGEPVRESWEQVKTAYPPLDEAVEPPVVAPNVTEAIVQANPFSPTRRPPSSVEGAPGGGGVEGTPQPPASKLVYKGRILVGQRVRAIIENTTEHKTHFLEVGQEVAGFKVLDIAERQVVVSDSQTHEDVVLSLTVTTVP